MRSYSPICLSRGIIQTVWVLTVCQWAIIDQGNSCINYRIMDVEVEYNWNASNKIKSGLKTLLRHYAKQAQWTRDKDHNQRAVLRIYAKLSRLSHG